MKKMERHPGRETSYQNDGAMGLTTRLLDFAPGVTREQLSEKQETALKKATVYFYRQLMLQQKKSDCMVSSFNFMLIKK